MSRSLTATLLLALLFGGTPALAQPPATGATPMQPRPMGGADAAAVTGEIRSMAAELDRAWSEHDPVAMASFWATDGKLVDPMGEIASGQQEVQRFFARRFSPNGEFERSRSRFVLSDVRVLGPRHAFVDLEHDILGVRAPDGRLVNQHFHVTTLLERDAAGRWRLLEVRPYAFLPPPAPPVGRRAR
jgi:uncharacterized protein (TIGR02246 family)